MTVFSSVELRPVTFEIILMLIVLIVLITISALVSGSESAYFSMPPKVLEKLHEKKRSTDAVVLDLMSNPQKLLATILIANNFVNVSIIMLSAVVSSHLIDFGDATTLKFIFETIIITALILFFGEVMPKIYSSQHSYGFASFVARPLKVATVVLTPFSRLLMKSTSVVNNRLSKHTPNMSLDDLQQAVELTSGDISEEKDMLEGIVKFTNLDAVDIMTPRLDVVSIDAESTFGEVLKTVVESGYSRIPVYNERPDEIEGILFVKDILPYVNKGNDFDWKKVLRKAYYIPETKKINDLLGEFQTSKTHMAIVVDEYGGMSGIVTLEDIIEEIVGEISDEFDDEEKMWHEMPDGSIEFEGKISLNDFFKVIDTDGEEFESARGEAETLAGLLLEINGLMPKKEEVIVFKRYRFEIISAGDRRIDKVRLTMDETEKNEEK